jgi:hypothetical protein
MSEFMSEFMRVIKPHLVAHNIDDAEELASRLRVVGLDKSDDQVERWFAGESQIISFVDVAGLEELLWLSSSEVDELLDAIIEDKEVRMAQRREEREDRREFDDLVAEFEWDDA